MPRYVKSEPTRKLIAMIKQLQLPALILLFVCYAHSSSAQNDDLQKHLSGKEIRRTTSAYKLIDKGDKIVDKTKAIQEEVDALKNADGRIKTRKINKKNKKVAEAKTLAAVYYEDGYKKYLSVLNNALKH